MERGGTVGLRAKTGPAPEGGGGTAGVQRSAAPCGGWACGGPLSHGSQSIAVGYIPSPAVRRAEKATPVGDYTHLTWASA